ncbi:hypothetical protein N658DRAFT_298142 [Parathielavia hyrcaniae]|uniref:Uncharacterized protein n=1 Tax=Parathielavia hyrcaniae TaxID=113614 RepID=A0AAN6Q977_9PEZI|nr:hypothetical protein N658DRAFT_298142 [Parathielavia hyrcaniae]
MVARVTAGDVGIAVGLRMVQCSAQCSARGAASIHSNTKPLHCCRRDCQVRMPRLGQDSSSRESSVVRCRRMAVRPSTIPRTHTSLLARMTGEGTTTPIVQDGVKPACFHQSSVACRGKQQTMDEKMLPMRGAESPMTGCKGGGAPRSLLLECMPRAAPHVDKAEWNQQAARS